MLIILFSGKADCGDIDILISRPTDDGKTHAGGFVQRSHQDIVNSGSVGVLHKLWQELHRRNILTEDLTLPEDWNDLENIFRGLCRKDSGSRRRRIGAYRVNEFAPLFTHYTSDFLTVPYKSRGAALLYYTVRPLRPSLRVCR